LAARLSTRFRVVCPDVVGRGQSDWFTNPDLYSVPIYIADMVTLVARLGVDKVDWVGTSMGGLIGMLYAALPGNAVDRLVMNDIGPVVSAAGRDRISGYVGVLPTFPDFDTAERALRTLMVDFGPHTDSQFRVLSQAFIVERDGVWTFHYDPKIAVAYHAAAKSNGFAPLWPFWDAIKASTLVLRGARSDILSAETANEMMTRGPRAQQYVVDGVGHAPTLIAEDQLAAVEQFLGKDRF
jgi:pimeloyl-ACP methyl ester carboxylesterase